METVVLDKTGTITEGRPFVQKIKCFHGFSTEEVVYHTALLEQTSTHPLAHAILEEAKCRNLPLIQPNADAKIEAVTGKGLFGVMNGRNIQVGSLSFLEEHGIQTKDFIITGTVFRICGDRWKACRCVFDSGYCKTWNEEYH